MIEGGHFAATGIIGTTSVSILIGQVGILQAMKRRNPMRGREGWRLWLLGFANSQDHGEATVTNLGPREKWKCCVEKNIWILDYKTKSMRYSSCYLKKHTTV